MVGFGGGGDEISFTMCGDTIDHYCRSRFVFANCVGVVFSGAGFCCSSGMCYVSDLYGLWGRIVVVETRASGTSSLLEERRMVRVCCWWSGGCNKI
jgi:hypothetical protein